MSQARRNWNTKNNDAHKCGSENNLVGFLALSWAEPLWECSIPLDSRGAKAKVVTELDQNPALPLVLTKLFPSTKLSD